MVVVISNNLQKIIIFSIMIQTKTMQTLCVMRRFSPENELLVTDSHDRVTAVPETLNALKSKTNLPENKMLKQVASL